MDIGFLNFGIWDVLDIAIVAYLIYRIYKLLQGSRAFSIFAGLFTLYIIWWIVNALHMQLVSNLLSQFASVGVILLIIVFQPEIRSFLLDLGQTTFGSRLDPVKRWLNISDTAAAPVGEDISITNQLTTSILNLKQAGRDAVIVLNSGNGDEMKYTGGVELNAPFDPDLFESLLLPDSAFKQGAVVIDGDRIKAVGARFPHSEVEEMPKGTSMRHRLALGATEVADVASVVVSSEDGTLSTAYKGYMAHGVNRSEFIRFVEAHTSQDN